MVLLGLDDQLGTALGFFVSTFDSQWRSSLLSTNSTLGRPVLAGHKSRIMLQNRRQVTEIGHLPQRLA